MKNCKKCCNKGLGSFKYPLIALLGVGLVYTLTSCKSRKSDTQVVQNFNAEKYLGKWYEIARFDFKHEKDLKNVTANYSKREDGKIKVLNKGYNYVKNEWQESKGKAKFVGSEKQGALKVSFFGPFYAGYNVVMMDPDYENVLVFGDSTDYIWILSRNKTIPEATKAKFLDYAKKHGYPLEKLVWTEQE